MDASNISDNIDDKKPKSVFDFSYVNGDYCVGFCDNVDNWYLRKNGQPLPAVALSEEETKEVLGIIKDAKRAYDQYKINKVKVVSVGLDPKYISNVQHEFVAKPIKAAKEWSDEGLNDSNVFDQAKAIVYGDRENTHGDPESNFGIIAEFWTTYLKRKYGVELTIDALDVGNMQTLLKIARLTRNNDHIDSLVDVMGYQGVNYRILKARGDIK